MASLYKKPVLVTDAAIRPTLGTWNLQIKQTPLRRCRGRRAGWRCWRRAREHDRDRERTRGLQLVENWGVAVAWWPVDWLSGNDTTYW